MNKVEELANKARNSLSDYCINECNAYCCRAGYILLSEDEKVLLVNDKEDQLLKENSLKPLVDGKYSLFLKNSLNGCPRLDGAKCTIHKNENRPSACKEFPIFVSEKEVKISSRCFGAKAGLLYPYIRQFIELGYKIV